MSTTPEFTNETGTDFVSPVQNISSAGEISRAIDELQRLVARDPDNAIAHNDLGVLYYEQGDKSRALRHYEIALGLDPKNHTTMKNLADFYFIEQRRIEEALTLYVDILKEDPKDVDALLASGTICVTLGQDNNASVFFERILEIDPWHERARQELDRMDNAPTHDFGGTIAAFGKKMAM